MDFLHPKWSAMTVDNKLPKPVYATIPFNPKTDILKILLFNFFNRLTLI